MKSKKPVSAETRRRYLVNLAMFVLFLGVTASSVYFLYVPGGYQGGRNPRYQMRIIFERETWDDIHVWTSMLLSAILFVHIILHANWIKQVFIKNLKIWKANAGESNWLRKINILDDGLSALFFLVCLFSGLVLFFIPGGRGTAFIEFMHITRDSWKIVHTWSGIAMLAGVVIHLFIHWKWIKKVSLKFFSIRRYKQAVQY